MRRIAYVLSILICITNALCYAEDSIPCEAYPDFNPRIYLHQDTLVYYIFNTQEYLGPAADSVWIENESRETVMVVHALQGENVDISSLEKGYHLCLIQLGECIGGRVFYKRNNPPQTSIDNVPISSSSATKILRNGQLYIERDGKMYTIQGIEVK